jgi:predicted ATPase
VIVERITCRHPGGVAGWPFTLPVVAQLIAEGLEFTAPVTFLAGDNGSGKSTIIEAIADVCKINSAGGKAGTRYASTSPKTPLGQVMDAEFTSCLGLISLLDRLAATGGQVICATHSPLLTALPGAQIVELGAHGIRPVVWTQLQFVDHWRRYLANPSLYLRHILDQEQP